MTWGRAVAFAGTGFLLGSLGAPLWAVLGFALLMALVLPRPIWQRRNPK